MGNAKSHTLDASLLEGIKQQTDFQEAQIQKLYLRFQALDRHKNGRLSREDFLHIPELAINPLADRILDMFIMEYKKSNQSKGIPTENIKDEVDFTAFCKTLNNFNSNSATSKTDIEDSSETSKEQKLKFLFQMYDKNDDGSVTKEELLELLKLMVGSNISDKQLELIASRTVGETDINHDHKLDFEEFKTGLARVDIDQKMTVRFT